MRLEHRLRRYGAAEVKWPSAFPSEDEVLYPPLTYLQPTGKPPQAVELESPTTHRENHACSNCGLPNTLPAYLQVIELASGQKFTVYEVKPTLP